MAKKSSKSTRRSRAKKEAVSKKQAAAPAVAEEVVAEAPKKSPAKRPATKKTVTKKKAAEKPIEQAVEAEAERLETMHSVEDMVRPQRMRMLVSAGVLAVVLVVSIIAATLMHNADATITQQAMMPSGKTATDPDKLLESGGKVCTNGSSQTNTQGSTNPGSAGMMLQSVPAQQIQTPQTITSANDAATLQGASCY